MFYHLSTLITACSLVSAAFADQAFVTSFAGNEVFAFNTQNTSVPATATTAISDPAAITFSPDGQTVYVTSLTSDDAYSFPAAGPYAPTALGVNVATPAGIAISTDGQTGFIASGVASPGLYAFPLGGSFPHTATMLTATATVIANPFFIVIQGSNAFVGDFQHSAIYSVSLNSTSYSATLVQSFADRSVAGLAISSDGYLYFSSVLTAGSIGQVLRVPLSSPSDTPLLAATNISTSVSGLAASSNGFAIFVTSDISGVYSFPINSGFPQTPTLLSSLAIPDPTSIAIHALPSPNSLTGRQIKNVYLLQTDVVNILNWQANPLETAAGYNIYRNGILIATVSSSTFTYEDHNRTKGVTTCYSVTAFDVNTNESAPITVCIP